MSGARLRAATAVLAAVLASGCDLGPGGPETLTGSVSGNPGLGAVVLDVTWPGVVAFEGRGSTQVYFATHDRDADRHRVLLVGPSGGDLPFAISLADPYLQAPSIVVVEAVGTDNLPVPVSGLQVVLSR